MSSSNVTGLPNNKMIYTIKFRNNEHLAKLIKKASYLMGQTKSEFIRNAITKEAQRVIAENTIHHLTLEDVKLFEEALENTPPLTPRALKAADSYRRRVIYAD